MAYCLEKSRLSPEQIIQIRSLLWMQPDVPMTKYNRGNIPEAIVFYFIEKDKIHLPFLFSAGLLQINPNINIKYPSCDLQFTGSLRENQIAVELEAWGQMEKSGTTTLGLYPGYGKTILGAKLASRAKLITLVLVHREILTIQWKKTFNDFSNAQVWIVGEKNPVPNCNVIICMDTRWSLIPPAVRDAIGFLIIDEAHAFCTPTHVNCLLAFHPKYIVAETATLERDDGMHNMIFSIVGSHGILRENCKPFSVMKIITNVKPERKMNRMGGVDWHALVNTTLNNERRNQIISDLVANNTRFTILILTSLVDHAMLIHKMLIARGISCDYMCGTKKSYTEATVLVGTTSKIGTGFDQATACPDYSGKRFNLLILVCSIKKYSMLVQNIGRVFRADYPTVMHLVDDDDIYRNHWNIARRWYLRRSGVVTEFNIPNPETPPSIPQEDWIKLKLSQLNKPK